MSPSVATGLVPSGDELASAFAAEICASAAHRLPDALSEAGAQPVDQLAT